MRTIGIIPARANSRRLPGKNMRPFCGKPLIQWTIEAAAESKLDAVCVASDDPDILKFAAIHIPDDRGWISPLPLLSDSAPVVKSVLFTLDKMEKAGEKFDAVMLLQPTNPLRTAGDIDTALCLLSRERHSVVSCTDFSGHHPQIWFNLRGALCGVEGWNRGMRDATWRRDGTVYLTRTKWLKESGELWHPCDLKTGILPIPRNRHININTDLDFVIAEAMHRYNESHASS